MCQSIWQSGHPSGRPKLVTTPQPTTFLRRAMNWPVTDNQPPPFTPGQLPGTSKDVCVCLNIIAPSIPLTDKTSVYCTTILTKSNPIIEYIRKMQYKLKCQAFFYILMRADSNLYRKELTVHWSAPNSLISLISPLVGGWKGSWGPHNLIIVSR